MRARVQRLLGLWDGWETLPGRVTEWTDTKLKDKSPLSSLQLVMWAFVTTTDLQPFHFLQADTLVDWRDVDFMKVKGGCLNQQMGFSKRGGLLFFLLSGMKCQEDVEVKQAPAEQLSDSTAAKGAGAMQNTRVLTCGKGTPPRFPTSEARGITVRAPLGKQGPSSLTQIAKWCAGIESCPADRPLCRPHGDSWMGA